MFAMSTWRDEYGRAKVCQCNCDDHQTDTHYEYHTGNDDEHHTSTDNRYVRVRDVLVYVTRCMSNVNWKDVWYNLSEFVTVQEIHEMLLDHCFEEFHQSRVLVIQYK